MHRRNITRLRYFMPPETGDGTVTGGGTATEQKPTQSGEAKPGAEAKPTEEGKGGKDAILADLAKERDKRQALEQEVEKLKGGTIDRDALAKALGIKPEEANEATKVAESIADLQKQFAETQRRATILELCASPGEDAEGKPLPAIPKEYQHLLTATDADALAAQAKSVAELVAVKAAQNQTPGFAESAGQGQGGGTTPPLPAQIAAAETDLRGKAPGTPEYRAAQQKVMDLKAQQLFKAHQAAK